MLEVNSVSSLKTSLSDLFKKKDDDDANSYSSTLLSFPDGNITPKYKKLDSGNGLEALSAEDLYGSASGYVDSGKTAQINKLGRELDDLADKIKEKKRKAKNASSDEEKQKLSREAKRLQRKYKAKARRYDSLNSQVQQSQSSSDDAYPTDILG